MSIGVPTNNATKRKIVALYEGGMGYQPIAKKLRVGVDTVKRALLEHAGVYPREVEPYVCPGCEAAGVWFKTNLKPCVRCRARAGR
jgi:hypothetical protein